MSAASGNYRLSPTSPAMDAGTWLLAPPVDLELTKRAGDAPGIGAYEPAGAR